MKVLLLACALAVSACVAAAVFAAEPFGEPPQLDQLQAGYYRLKIGKIAQFEDPSIAVAFANLIVDILYAFIDPRVRYA